MNISALKNKDFSDIAQLCGYMDIMVDVCRGQTPTVRINGSEYSRAMVRQRMYELDASHFEYVLERMKECAPKVRNIRAYALSTLYNSHAILQRGPISGKRREKARKRYKNWRNAEE